MARIRARHLALLPLLVPILPCNGEAAGTKVIFSFDGTDGALPTSTLLYDKAGLYGTAAGVLYKVTPKGAETELVKSGIVSFSPLIKLSGALYGTNSAGYGSVFKSTLSGTVTTLHSFTFNGRDGIDPCCGLLDVGGTLYGTTTKGGTNGTGTVFSVTTGGTEAVLYSFGTNGSNDGVNPVANLVDIGGMFYGTTGQGGANNTGTIFSMTPAGAETQLYAFKSSGDGVLPNFIMTINGIIYGTTLTGGKYGAGTVFSFNPSTKTEALVYSFKGAPSDGYAPNGFMAYSNGTFYGTTQQGGTAASCNNAGDACGTVWSVTTAGKEKLLHSFTSASTDGGFPEAGLIMVKGKLYGATVYGGTANVGTVFSVTP